MAKSEIVELCNGCAAMDANAAEVIEYLESVDE